MRRCFLLSHIFGTPRTPSIYKYLMALNWVSFVCSGVSALAM